MPLEYFGWFFLAFGATWLATKLVHALAKKKSLLDQPEIESERRVHKKPIPQIGGIGIFIVFSLILLVLLDVSEILTSGAINIEHYIGFLLGGLVLMIGGYLDDRYRLSAKISIAFPLVAALMVIGFGVEIEKLTNPFGGVVYLDPWLSDVLVFTWLMGVMYTTKLLDGLDGLSTGVSAIGVTMIMFLSLSAAYYQPDVALLSFVALGVLLGFLVWNFFPAKIFLGEGGSTYVGFMLGTLAVISGGKLATALLVIGIPVLDVMWVIVRRYRSGGLRQIFSADRLHLHHRLFDLGWTQRRVVLFYYFIAAAFGISTLFLQSHQKLIALGTLGLFMVIVVWILIKRKEVGQAP
jgi:UDP-GlcNAc:undecaprenyl-phosphate/decaprenyl-phosphate GlcNAc-1-phosphate transferase